MKIAFFDTHQYERPPFDLANAKYGFDITWFESRLTTQTAQLALGHNVVCSFVEDDLSQDVLSKLSKLGVEMLALRSAGFNHVNVAAAKDLNMSVARVPEYSPHAVAEHAAGLLLCLNRKIHRAYHRVRDQNFSLEGLVGFDLNNKTVGVIGTGRIGRLFCQIMRGFGCHVLAYDIEKNLELAKSGVEYVELKRIFECCDIISLHAPLTPQTYHLINRDAIDQMRPGVFLINTSRGALIDRAPLVEELKSGKIGGAALDVYEEEEGIFFQNLSDKILQDDILARLLTLPNVLITSHQAFLTTEALKKIAEVTLYNIDCFAKGVRSGNEL